MYILNIASTIKKTTVDVSKDFIYENYYKRVGFNKENTYYSLKRQKEKIYYHFQLN